MAVPEGSGPVAASTPSNSFDAGDPNPPEPAFEDDPNSSISITPVSSSATPSTPAPYGDDSIEDSVDRYINRWGNFVYPASSSRNDAEGQVNTAGVATLGPPAPVDALVTRFDGVEGRPNQRLSWAERRLTRSKSGSDAAPLIEAADNVVGHGFQYEEFMKDSVPCPTCGGGGHIDPDTESKLIALIPYDDERLKPRRTWIYVGIGIAVSVALAALTLFFLFPRSVQISSEKKRLEPIRLEIDANSSSPSVFLTIRNEFIVENANYVPVFFESITMRVTVFDQNLNSTVNRTRVLVPIRSRLHVYATVDLHFRNALSFIAPYCADHRKWMHTFLFKFDVAAQASFMQHSQDMTFSVFQYVSCGREETEIEGGNKIPLPSPDS